MRLYNCLRSSRFSHSWYFALAIIILFLEVGRWKWLEETSGLNSSHFTCEDMKTFKLITPSGPFLGGHNLSSLVKKQNRIDIRILCVDIQVKTAVEQEFMKFKDVFLYELVVLYPGKLSFKNQKPTSYCTHESFLRNLLEQCSLMCCFMMR